MTVHTVKKKPAPAKKISDDEFMAAAIGDVQWLKQSLKDKKGQITFDKNGLSPIHLASIHGRLDCIRLLVENYDVDVNLPSSTGWRPIHLCISNQTGKRAYACLTYLLEKEADPSVANEDGVTPVHQAASEGHVQCLKLLLELGARIDVQDCRGNLPIDLAKLWGHRMCARILATEMWHREKDSVAREMRQLKKARMREVLDQLEHAEAIAEEEKFYGREAFADWLRDSKAKAEAKARGERRRSPVIRQGADKARGPRKEEEAPMRVRPNAQRPREVVRAPAAPARLRDRPVDPHRVQVAGREHVPASPGPRLSPEERRAVAEGASTADGADGGQEVRPIERPPFWNESSWDKSTHAPGAFNPHMPLLRDAYPRDPWTRLPHPRRSAPPELNVTAEAPRAVLEGETDQQLLQSLADVERRRLPKQVPYGKPGPVVYNCKNIIDVQTRRKYALESLPRSQAALHLCDDVDSTLFQSALHGRPQSAGSSTRTTSTAISGISDWSEPVVRAPAPAVGPPAAVRNLFVSMARPRHFPPLKGKEYVLDLGDVAARG